MKSFTSANLDTIRKDINAALKSVAQKHSIALSIGGIKYDSEKFHTKLEAVIQNSENAGMSLREIEGLRNLKDYGSMFGVSEKDYGKKFTNWDGQTFKLVGLMPSRPKYPVVAESTKTGKMFKFTESVLTKLKK